jgi:hypothetical protein
VYSILKISLHHAHEEKKTQHSTHISSNNTHHTEIKSCFCQPK